MVIFMGIIVELSYKAVTVMNIVDTVDMQMIDEKELDKLLISAALEARKKAYTPYSHFSVGAALLTKEGKIYTGCNIENAAYTPTNCAERTAIFKAISEGDMHFSKIAVVGGPDSGIEKHTYPCAVCRQVMAEFVNPEKFEVIVAIDENDYRKHKFEEILPYLFGPGDLDN